MEEYAIVTDMEDEKYPQDQAPLCIMYPGRGMKNVAYSDYCID